MAGQKSPKEVLPNNELWHRGGKLNEKRPVHLTDEQKAHIAACDGAKKNHKCKNPIYVCSACGNYGCAQEVADKCSKQGFKNDHCLYCGAADTRIPVMESELAGVMAAWEARNL